MNSSITEKYVNPQLFNFLNIESPGVIMDIPVVYSRGMFKMPDFTASDLQAVIYLFFSLYRF